MTISGRIHNLSVLAAGLLGAALLTTAPSAGRAHDVADDLDLSAKLGHSSGAEAKRARNTGKGMPSVRGPFPDSVNMTFLGQLTNNELGASRLVFTGASFLSDIWGWTSPGEQEYALVGTSSGIAFARITDPTKPEFLGIVPTTNPNTTRNFWWDLKTFNNHVYWTTEVNDAGVGIFELTKLDDMPAVAAGSPESILKADARWGENRENGYIRAHNISINEATGMAYLTGASKVPAVDPDFTDDGTIILDLNGNPLAPLEVGQILNIDSHDAQIVNYHGPDTRFQGREIAIVSNGTDLELGIYDVTDKDDIVEISVMPYRGAGFTHQGWLTEDHRFFLMGDEEDELFGVSDPRNPDLPDTARTFIWDVRKLDAPVVIDKFDSSAANIDHNLFIRGDKVYQAHYTAGIRVLGIIDKADGTIGLEELGHMDTEPRLPNNHMNHNINIFVGPWGVFPFFESDTIAASDGLNGLVLMKLGD